MTRSDLFAQIQRKQSYLCVGLDPDLRKLPAAVQGTADPIFEFNRRIVEATQDVAVAYKPNLAFYEALGPRGWVSLQRTLEIIPADCFTIADAKRGDIGNTSSLYARAFFEPEAAGLNFDSVTVAPYMGRDSVVPFLDFVGKWVILLALTSNEGSADFQRLRLAEGFGQGAQGEDISPPPSAPYPLLFEHVLTASQAWGTPDQLMYVVGATQAEALTRIRERVPDHFLLVPGVGAQGGSLEEVSKFGMNRTCGLLVNASRSILYASSGDDFAKAAGAEARRMQTEMAGYLARYLPA